MIDKLIALLGKSIESEEIKSLFTEWRAAYPEKTTCTVIGPGIKSKVEKDCVRLYFGIGGHSKYLKPIPSPWKDTFIAIFTTIEFTKKRKGGIPFDVEFVMTDDELTAILGKPEIVNYGSESKTWRKTYKKKYELVVRDESFDDGTSNRTMHLSFKYEDGLSTYEDYDMATL